MRLPALAWLLLCWGCGSGADAPPPRGPNILLVLTDDQRFDTLSCTGSTLVQTPVIDRLAIEGVLFERAYVTTSLCCPARASLLTGQYPHRTGIRNNDDATDFLSAQPDFPELLQAAGWRTGFIGKWHIANAGAAPQPGFERWVSFEGQGQWEDELYNVDGELRRIPGFNTDVLVDQALQFLAESDERPFCLVLSLKNLHGPYVPAARHRSALADVEFPEPVSLHEPDAALPAALVRARAGKRNGWFEGDLPRAAYVRGYYALLLSVEDNLERLLGALESTDRLDDTAVVYTSDGGFLWGEHGMYRKRSAYEPSIHVPLLMRYPPRVPAGTRSQALVTTLDIAPTLLSAAGLPIPDRMQGRDLLPSPDGTDQPWRERFLYVDGWGRALDGPMELAVVEQRFKYVVYRRGTRETRLFDREADPAEMEDLSASPAWRAECERLEGALVELLVEAEAPVGWATTVTDDASDE